jgi:hypothetical protein
MMMRRDEWLAGAPIYRGRWAAVAALWWAGYFVGRTNPLVDLIIDHTWEPWDFTSDVVGAAALILGIMFIDQYGRNAWFAWAPDDAQWDHRFTRDQVNRTPVLDWPRHRTRR